MPRTLRLRWLLVVAALACCAAAQLVNPEENVASARGPWIADRYGDSHVLVCFDVLDPRVPLPKGGVPFAKPGTNLCDQLQLTADQMEAAQALAPGGEPFHMGGAYRLLLGGGLAIRVQVSVLTASQGSYSTGDPSIDSYLGAVLSIAPADVTRFRAAKGDIFVLQRVDADYAPAAQPRFAQWGPPPPGAVENLESLMKPDRFFSGSNLVDLNRSPTLAVETVTSGDQTIYLVRATWPTKPGAPAWAGRFTRVAYAWAELTPAPHIVGQPETGTLEGSEQMEGQKILNVVALGNGRAAILFDDEGEYHWSHELLVLSPDGSLKVVHAYGATSD